MRKALLFTLAFCFFFCGRVIDCSAQDVRAQARTAEWQSFALPKTNFVRRVGPNKNYLYRLPADWEQEPTGQNFTAKPYGRMMIYEEKIADGLPLVEYVAAIMRTFRGMPGVAERAVLRRTEIQDLEAREIVIEMPDVEGEMNRTLLWVTVQGPLALTFSLSTPLAHTAEVEPIFKAVVQSIVLLQNFEYTAFDAMRLTAIKTSAAAPVDEVQRIIASLNELRAVREPLVARLAAMFVSTPDMVVDLLLDRRPLVRGAAVEALARSGNAALRPFLWRAVDDDESIIAEHAARALSTTTDVVEIAGKSLSGGRTELIARLWPFLSTAARTEILSGIFSRTAAKVPPPSSKEPTKHDVKVVVTELVPQGKTPSTITNQLLFFPDPSIQLGGITLLRDVKADQFKLPLTRILGAENDALTAAALQTANERSEQLPVDPLLKLLMSSSKEVARSAAENLGLSGTVANIATLEKLIALEEGTKSSSSDEKDKPKLANELKLSIKKIRFRDQITKSPAQSKDIIKQGLADPDLVSFVWRHVCPNSRDACGFAPSSEVAKRDFEVKPFGENLFPEKVEHFLALPKPDKTVERFYESLQSIQMESARGQSTLVLVMGGIRGMLGRDLAAPADAFLFDYTGIKAAPVSMVGWLPAGAPETLPEARRRAIVLRIEDRERFERLIDVYQKRSGGAFADLPIYLAGFSRGLAALPAVLPVVAQAMTSTPSKPKTHPILKYSVTRRAEVNGVPVKVFERRQVNSEGKLEYATTYLAVLGDTAILTNDSAGMSELLANAYKDTPKLANNSEFRKVSQSNGDVIYFSDLSGLLTAFSADAKDRPPQFRLNESGELNIMRQSWENSHHLSFEESDWSKSLIPFQPSDLSAPSVLLPSSTLAYFFMKVDWERAWSTWLKRAYDQKSLEEINGSWLLNFEREVLPELGPECGAAILDLPNFDRTGDEIGWVNFCTVKSDKIANALAAGKLLRGLGPGATEFKSPSGTSFVTLKNGFLIFSNRAKALELLDRKEKLVSNRDFSRAAAKVPKAIVAFGGYSLESAFADFSLKPDEPFTAHTVAVITSLAKAFHSQNLFATATAGTVEAKSSVSMDREGRYAVSELSYQPSSTITYSTVEARGIPIVDQKRVSRLVMRIKSKASGAVERIKDDVKSAHQSGEQKSSDELVITVASRKEPPDAKISLPITRPDLAPFLKPTRESPSDDERIIKQAKEIVGEDREAWSVARKLADWTFTNLQWKFVASADPARTLATREADCSEFSELYIAMARSLGLPARLVLGLAHSGGSFGGHAWVEVWVGKWIELDPTWGTDFVDATHIRSDSNALLTYSALNLIDLEVLEASRIVPEYQLKSRSLGEELAKTIPLDDTSALEAAFDLSIATDLLMGEGSWLSMNDAEREQIGSAFHKAVTELIIGYGKNDDGTSRKIRMLHVDEKGDRADVICIASSIDALLKFRLLRRANNWHLIDIVIHDTNLHLISEALKPTLQAIADRRAGRTLNFSAGTDVERVLLLYQAKPAKAIEIAERALKLEPKHQGLRYLKAQALFFSQKRTEAINLLTELGQEQPPLAIALKELAEQYNLSEDEAEKKQVPDLYKRYLALEPYDARAHLALASIYENAKDTVLAEASYRKAIEIDPSNAQAYVSAAEFLVHQQRFNEAATLLATGDKVKTDDDDLFASIIFNLYLSDDYDCMEAFTASQPARMQASTLANYYLGLVAFEKGRYLQALRLEKLAARLDPQSADPLTAMAAIYRKLGRWRAAIDISDRAIAMESENGEAHYHRACALARLGRKSEAMLALARSLELDKYASAGFAEEQDLKSLSALPAFKKLVAESAKQQ